MSSKTANRIEKSYTQLLLYFTVLESLPAMTIATANHNLNLLWLFLKPTSETSNPTYFTAHMAQGYGFWAFAWAIASLCIATSNELHVRRLFARLSSVLYAVWWALWWHAIFHSSIWNDWVLVAYTFVRGLQLIGFIYFGWFSREPSNESLVKAKRS
jgi:hypothetical protein